MYEFRSVNHLLTLSFDLTLTEVVLHVHQHWLGGWSARADMRSPCPPRLSQVLPTLPQGGYDLTFYIHDIYLLCYEQV